MDWSTRVTRLFSCKYPIIEGSFGSFGTSALAAAVSEAGGLGLITAGALRTPERLRQDIRKARSLTDKPFGVNISIGLIDNPEEMLQVAIEEKVPVLETSAFRADDLGRIAQEAGMVWIHKSATVKHAASAERHGADAVVIVGLEGGGFKNRDQLTTSINIPLALRQIRIPVIAAGGIGDARGFLSALSLGAEAIYLGTAFMATQECPISERRKQMLVQADPSDRDLRDRVLAPPDPEEFQNIMNLRGSLNRNDWMRKLEDVLLKEPSDSRHGKTTSKLDPSSLAVAFIDRILTVKELFDSIILGAEDILSSGEFPGVKNALTNSRE